jgi:TfoX/Sxy family transcriptional regulator of competence genes
MAFDEGLAQRIREQLADLDGLGERRMFGGICFLLDGAMLAGVLGDDLIARVGKDGYSAALEQPHARPFDFAGRPSNGIVYVAPEGIAEDRALAKWLDRAIAFVRSAPAKTGAKRAGVKKAAKKAATAAKKSPRPR